MRCVGVLAASVVAVAVLVTTASMAWAEFDGAASPTVLAFAGTDLWRQGQFIHGGLLLAPAGFDADGFAFKLLFSGGNYAYFSGGLGEDVDGRALTVAALPGWRFRRGNFIATVYVGPEIQNHRLTPDDPGSRLRGFYTGALVGGDVWIEPNAQFMVAADASVGTIGPTATLRAAMGWRLLDAAFVGPETQMIWCANYQELRIGAHVTGLHLGQLEWLAASGWAHDSDGKDGPYLRLGVVIRY